MEPKINPLILVFDLDETLFLTKTSEDDDAKSRLSSSSKRCVSTGNKGQIYDPLLLSKIEGHDIYEYHAAKVSAINRKKIKKIFKEISKIMWESNRRDIKCPIAVKVITSGTYEVNSIKSMFDYFYGRGKNTFSNGNLPIEYFNRDDLDNSLKKKHDTTKTTKSGLIDPKKADLMNRHYPVWKNAMPGLRKKRVILIDNLDQNTQAALQYGFGALHYPTTPDDRNDALKFSIQGPHVLDELSNLVKELKKSVLIDG